MFHRNGARVPARTRSMRLSLALALMAAFWPVAPLAAAAGRTGDAPTPATAAADAVQGYASAANVRQGGTLDLHISSDVPQYDIQVARIGGSGWTVMTTINKLSGHGYNCGPVGAPAGQENVALGCKWPVAYTLPIPADWPSGIYAAQLLAPGSKPGGYGNYIFFVVTPSRPGSTARILFQAPTNTWEAYNYFLNSSFYSNPPARRVTFDRPYPTCTLDKNCPTSASSDLSLAQWLESQGYTMEYVASQDLHADPAWLTHYALLILPGHDEYWTAEMRRAVDAFIAHGGNVAIFSGNTGYRQVRYTDGGHTLVCYKEDFQKDPLYHVDNSQLATEFSRTPSPNWPQNTTIGLGWVGYLNHKPGDLLTGKYTVYHADNWIYAATSVVEGDTLWYEPTKDIEVDGTAFTMQDGMPVVTGEKGTPANFIILGVQQSSQGFATMGLYSLAGGGTVFNAATMGWARGLSPDNNPQSYAAVQQITRNVVSVLSSRFPAPVDDGPFVPGIGVP